MESLSNKPNQKEGANSLQADLEALKNTDKEIYESIQKDLQEADQVWEKAQGSLKGLENKEVHVLKSMMKPPQDVLGVLCACMHLMAGVVPESCIDVDEKKNPTDLTWKGCWRMLGDWRFFRDQMLGMKKLVDEGKVADEKIENVRSYLKMEWFDVESVKVRSLPASQFCEAVRKIVCYFDIVKEIRVKIKIALGKSGEGSQGNGLQERED